MNGFMGINSKNAYLKVLALSTEILKEQDLKSIPLFNCEHWTGSNFGSWGVYSNGFP